MYRALLLSIFLTNFLTAGAQSWHAGFRLGPSWWLTRSALARERFKSLEGQPLTLDVEATLQRQTAGKWSLEAGLGTRRFRQEADYAFDGRTGHAAGTAQAWSLRLEPKLDVTYPLLNMMFPQMPKMRSFIGFIGAPTLTSDDIRVTPEGAPPYRLRRNRTDLWVGFSYTHHLQLGPRLDLVSVYSFSGLPFAKYRDMTDVLPLPNKRVAWHSGIRLKL